MYVLSGWQVATLKKKAGEINSDIIFYLAKFHHINIKAPELFHILEYACIFYTHQTSQSRLAAFHLLCNCTWLVAASWDSTVLEALFLVGTSKTSTEQEGKNPIQMDKVVDGLGPEPWILGR